MAAHVSTFESASRFEGADESEAQATISTNMVALSYRIFSLGHVLVDYAFGAAIRIAYGDRDGGDEDGRDGARSAVRSGGCCAAKTAPPHKTCALRVLQHPLRPANQFPKNRIDHRAPFGQRKRRPWSIVEDQSRQKPSRAREIETFCKIQQIDFVEYQF